MKEKKFIKIPKDFFKLKFKVTVPKFAIYYEDCPLCREWRDDELKKLAMKAGLTK